MKPKIKFTPLQWAMQIVSSLLLLFTWIYAALKWSSIPQRIPTHFDAAGVADGWGSKSSLIVIMIIATVMFAGITALAFFPAIWNTAVNVTPQNAPYIYTISRSMIISSNLCVVGTFSYIIVQVVRGVNLGVLFLPISMIALFGLMGYYIWRQHQVSKQFH